MSRVNRGLGRGLDILFSSGSEQPPPEQNQARPIPIKQINPNPLQPRKHFSDQSLQELAQSIRQQGVLQPILLRPDPTVPEMYQIVAGERRWRAANQAGQETILSMVQEMTDSESILVGLVENLQREDLNPIEEAEALGHIQQELNLSQEALAQKTGKSRPSLANSLRLLQLDANIIEAVRSQGLSAGAARTLLAITDQESRQVLFAYIMANNTPVRQVESAVNHWKAHGRLPGYLWSKTGSPQGKKTPEPLFETLKQSFVSQVRNRLDCPVKISGNLKQGRITLSYRTETELQKIFEHFGLSSTDVSRETS